MSDPLKDIASSRLDRYKDRGTVESPLETSTTTTANTNNTSTGKPRMSTNDLKSQFNDLQKKLSTSGSRRSSNAPIHQSSPTKQQQHRRSAGVIHQEGSDIPIHLPPMSLTQFQEDLRASRRDAHNSLTRSNRANRTSLVGGNRLSIGNANSTIPGSSTANNRLSQAGTQATNVDFLSDLSDGLLIESRRLTLDNKNLVEELNKEKEENSKILKQIQNLNIINKKLSENEESLKDKNWELETDLNKYKKLFQDSNLELSKISKKLETNSSQLSILTNDYNSLQLIKDNLNNELTSNKSTYESKIKELKTRITDLNDENDTLYEKNEQLTQSNKQLIDKITDLNNVNNTKDIDLGSHVDDDDDDDDELQKILNNPNLFSIANDSNKENLEKDCIFLKNNLNHANSSIIKLRNYLLRLKIEKQDLEKKLSQENTSNTSFNNSFNSPAKKSPSKKSLKKSLSPNKRNSKVLVTSFEDSTNEEGWENYTDDHLNQSSIPKLLNESSSSSDEEADFQFVNMSTDTINSSRNVNATKARAFSRSNKFLSDELNELNQGDRSSTIPPVPEFVLDYDQVELYCSNNGYKLIPIADYEKHLKESQMTHDKVLIEAAKFDILALPNDNTKPVQIDEQHIDRLIKTCKQLRLIPLTQKEFKELSSKAEKADHEPSDSELIAKLNSKDMVVLSNLDHKELLNKSEKLSHPDINYLSNQIETNYNDTYKLLPIQKYSELVHQLDQPDIQYIKDKSETLDHVVVPSNQHKSLLEELSKTKKDFQSVQQKYEISSTKIADLEEKINQPDLEYIMEKCSSHNHVVIPVDEHAKLNKNIGDLEFKLDEKTTELNEVVKSKSQELDELKLSLNEKSNELEELKQSLESKTKELNDMHRSLEQPDLEYIMEKSSSHNHVVIPVDQHNKLNTEINELKTQLDAKSKELNAAQTSLEEPDLTYIMTKSASHNHVVIPVDEHTKLNEELNELRSKLDSKDKELTEAQSASAKDIETKILELEQLKLLIETKNKEYDDLEASLVSKTEKLEDLQKSIEEPELQYIMEKSSSHNHVVIPVDEHAKLNEEIAFKESAIGDLKSKLNDKTNELSEVVKSKTDDLEKLQSSLDMNSKELEELKRSLESKTKELSDVQASLEQPDLNYIMTKSASHNHVVIPIDQLDKLKNEINELKTQLDLKLQELQDAQTSLEQPDLNYIMTKSTSHNHVVIPVDQHNKLNNEVTELKMQLESKSHELSALQVSLREEIEQLKSSLSTKSNEVEELQCAVESHKKELSNVQKALDEPELDYIMEKSSSHNHVVISVGDHTKLNDEITFKADEIESLKSRLDEKTKELDAAKSTLDQPELSYIMEKSTSYNHVVIPVDQHASLKNEIDELKTTLASRMKELDEIKEQLERPGLNYIMNKSESHGHVVIPVDEHEKLNKDLASLKLDFEHATKSNIDTTEVLKSELTEKAKELEEVKSKYDHPDLDYIKEKSQSLYGQAVVPVDQLNGYETEINNNKAKIQSLESSFFKLSDDFTNPTEEYLAEKAKAKSLVLLPVDQHKRLVTDAETPPFEIAKKIINESPNFRVMATSYVNRLENPTKETIMSKASSFGLVSIANSTYQTMRNTIEKPSLGFLTSNLSSYGYKTIPQGEFDTLTKSAASDSNGLGAGGASAAASAAVSTSGAAASAAIAAATTAAGLGVTAIGSPFVGSNKNGGEEEFSSPPALRTYGAKSPAGSAPSSPLSRKYNFEAGFETVDSLKKKCSEMGLVAVSKSTYESSLISSKRQLTFVELKERVEQFAHVMLPKVEFDELITIFGSQGEAFRTALDQILNTKKDQSSALIELRTLTENQSKAANAYEHPSESYFHAKASELGLHVMPLIEFKKAQSKSEMTPEKIQEYLKSNSLVVMDQAAYDEMEKSLDSKEDTISALQGELESAKNPSVELCVSVLSADGTFKVLSIEEYNQLVEAAADPCKDKVISLAKSHELVPLSSSEHEELLSSVESFKSSLSEKDLAMATLQTELTGQKEDYSNLTEKFNAVNEELEALKLQMSQRELELGELKASHDEKLKSIDELNTLIESPDIEFLNEKAASYKMTLISSESHDNLNSKLADNDRELEDLRSSHDSKADEINNLQNLIEQKENEIELLKAQIQDPEIDYIKDKALSHEMIVVPSQEHSNLRSDLLNKQSEVEDLKAHIESPELNYLQEKALSHEMVVVSSEEHSNLKTELMEKKSEIELLKTQIESPELDYIKDKALSHEMIVVPSQEHSNLQTDLLGKNAEVESRSSEIISLKQQLESMTMKLESAASELEGKNTEIESYSSNIALLQEQVDSKTKELELAVFELEEKKSELDGLSAKYESPSVDYVKEKAISHSMIAIPSDHHEELLKKGADVETLNSQLKSLNKDLEEKTLALNALTETNDKHAFDRALVDEELEARSAELDSLKATLSEKISELDAINKQLESPSSDYVKEKAANHSLIAIPLDEHSKILNSSESAEEGLKAASSELTLKTAEIESLKNTIEQANAKYEQSLLDIDAKNKEIDLLKEDIASKSTELEGLNDKIANPDLDYINEKSALHSVTLVDSAKYNELQSSLEKPTVEYITSKAGLYGLRVLTLDEYNQLYEKANAVIPPPNLDVCKSILGAAGLTAVSAVDFKTYQDVYDSRDQYVSKDMYNKLQSEAQDTSATLTQLKSQLDESSYIHENASKFGLVVLTEAEYNALKHLESEKSLSSQNEPKLISNPLLSGAYVSSDSVHNDTVYVDAVSHHSDENGSDDDERDLDTDHDSLFEEDMLREKAAALGYELIPLQHDDDDTSIEEHGEDDEIPETHMIGTAQVERLDVEALFDPEELKVKAGIIGYELIDAKELARLKEYENIDVPKLREIAASLNMSVVELTKSVADNDTTIPLEKLQDCAAALGLSLLSKHDIERLKRRNVTAQDLATKAAELNLTLLSEAELQNLKSAMDLPIPDLQKQASSKGYMVISESQFVATTVSRKPDVKNVIVLPSTYYNKLIRSHEWFKKSGMKSEMTSTTLNTLAQPPAPTPIDADRSFNNDSIAAYSPVQENHSFSLSDLHQQHSRAPSLHTVNTDVSFSSHEMISIITQTIIGEYVFKYYRRLGPFSVLSESRHERYFWIHPYSLTLYWSTSNPVLGDPAENKIRAIAIVSVESVEDKNPLPPGLYHRSIVIHSHDRSIKITCPTRQRHNIWLNSLRYLIERSTDDLVDDDDVENQYNESYTIDERVAIERSQSFRHDKPRNSTYHSDNTRSASQIHRKSSKSLIGSIVSGGHTVSNSSTAVRRYN